jgi:hypothetical protein
VMHGTNGESGVAHAQAVQRLGWAWSVEVPGHWLKRRR